VKALLELLAVAAVFSGAVLAAAWVTRPRLLPPRDDTGPVTYPDEDNQREEVPR
jgi:hypothetical protein